MKLAILSGVIIFSDAQGVTCTSAGDFTGNAKYTGLTKPIAAPLRGSIGCVTGDALKRRPTADVKGVAQAAVNVFGPMEAGFSNVQPGMSCLGTYALVGGVDTHLAETIMAHVCAPTVISVLDYCGGHAIPYHYHEKMSCLYTNDTGTRHSTKIGVAGDGNGIYGPYINGGVLPTDTDGCGGRTGVTPDSAGTAVYYYPVKPQAPFTLGCFGPGSQAQCRALYSGCSGTSVSFTTDHGKGMYLPDCPCFDTDGSNVPNQGRPGFLPPLNGNTTVTTAASGVTTAAAVKKSAAKATHPAIMLPTAVAVLLLAM